jgi:DnaJ-class molecular chaperone
VSQDKTTDVQMLTCPECDGEGHHVLMSEFPVPCRTCGGRRKVTWHVHFKRWLSLRPSMQRQDSIAQLEAYLAETPEARANG